MPGLNPLAPLLAVTKTLVPVPASNVPESGPIFIQADVFERVQFRALLPVLVITKDTVVGVNGPPGGPLDPMKAGVITRSSGRSNASCTQTVVELLGDAPLTPMPRLAKAAHNCARLAPPLSTRSAWIMPSRACRKLGFAGERFIPSVTICSAN